jgi:signal transduction histidine kinase
MRQLIYRTLGIAFVPSFILLIALLAFSRLSGSPGESNLRWTILIGAFMTSFVFIAYHGIQTWRQLEVIREILLQMGRQALAIARAPNHATAEPGLEGELQWLTMVFSVLTDSLHQERAKLEVQIAETASTSQLAQQLVGQINPTEFPSVICRILLKVTPALVTAVAKLDGTMLACRVRSSLAEAVDLQVIGTQLIARAMHRATFLSTFQDAPVQTEFLPAGQFSGISGQSWLVSLTIPGSQERAEPRLITLLLSSEDVSADAIPSYWNVYETFQHIITVAYERSLTLGQQRQTIEMLERANRMKSEFLATMSHELRSPLNVIIGYSHVLLEGLDGELTTEQATDVERIARAAQNLFSLIADILDFSKLDADRLDLHLEEFSPQEIVTSAVNPMQLLARQKGLTLSTFIDPHAMVAWGDPARISQILVNLLSNAVKFTDAGSIHVSVSLEESNVVRFSVEDTGIGIPEDQFDAIFEEFYQIDGSPQRRYGGAGLGLAISQHLALLHGTRIEVSSKINQGSTFWFTLPAKPLPGYGAIASQKQQAPGVRRMNMPSR